MISTNENIGGGGTSQDFARFVDLQQAYTELANKLAGLEVAINLAALKVAQNNAEAYVVLQEESSRVSNELTTLFESHPEWRGEKKNVTTPYGVVEKRKATELEVLNPAVTVALIEARYPAEPDLLRISKEPALEALERLNDQDLAALGVRRVVTEKITVKPSKINVAKAVKAAKASSAK